jgi:hypothetical protein
VTSPEEAVERAREAAADMRAAGVYPQKAAPATAPVPGESTSRLLRWAEIEPDLRDVRSTRRYGAPITALKRGLLRLLGQYHAELIANQTRFNIQLLIEVRRLEDRIATLERQASKDGSSGEPPAP